jgi:hypothetical protein
MTPPLTEQEIRALLEWALAGGTGTSSKAIARAATGDMEGSAYSYPRDPDDLGRCLRLIARVPACRAAVDALGAAYPCTPWPFLAEAWDTLAETMDAEVGLEGQRGDRAPCTYAMMKAAEQRWELLRKAQEEEDKRLRPINEAPRDGTLIHASGPHDEDIPVRWSAWGGGSWAREDMSHTYIAPDGFTHWARKGGAA